MKAMLQLISRLLNLSSDTKKLVQMQTNDLTRCLAAFQANIHLSKEEIKQLRNERLRKLLIFAKQHSPWYQNSLAKIDIENFTEERLIEIPTVNRSTLMDNWDLFVTNPKLSLTLVEKHIEKMSQDENAVYLQNHYHVLTTSKTTGKHGVFIYDQNEWNEFYAYFLRYSFHDEKANKIFTNPGILKIAQVIVCNMIYVAYAFSRTFDFKHLQRHYLPVTLPTTQIIYELNRIQPHILQGTPTTIYKLCQEASKGTLDIQPQLIFLTGESLYKPMRSFMKKIWPNTNILNYYGASEGFIANNCHADSTEMHLNDDAYIIEPVDENNKPVEKETLANKFYFTNLYNYTLPLIRYEMTDKIRLLNKTCECGSNHQLIEEPQGRLEYDFIYDGNIFVHHLVFVTPLLLEKNILDYQVFQTKRGVDIRILNDGFVNIEMLKKDISSKLTALNLINPEINIVEVKDFEYLPSGKLRRFIKMT